MGMKVLDHVKVSKVMVLGGGLALGGASLIGLHLVVDEVGWSNLTSAGNDLEGDVERYGGE